MDFGTARVEDRPALIDGVDERGVVERAQMLEVRQTDSFVSSQTRERDPLRDGHRLI
jgi:hypothetical protein